MTRSALRTSSPCATSRRRPRGRPSRCRRSRRSGSRRHPGARGRPASALRPAAGASRSPGSRRESPPRRRPRSARDRAAEAPAQEPSTVGTSGHRELDERVELSDRDLIVVTKAGVALVEEPPGASRSPASSAAANERTRAFSVTTCRSRRIETGRAHPRSPSSTSSSALGADEPQRRARARAAAPHNRTSRGSARHPSRRSGGQSAGIAASRYSSVEQSKRSAEPARPRRHAAWSRIPHGTRPHKLGALTGQSELSGSSSKSATAQSARAIATSRAAEDESPAPAGRSERWCRPARRRAGRGRGLGRNSLAVASPTERRRPRPSAAKGSAGPKRGRGEPQRRRRRRHRTA